MKRERAEVWAGRVEQWQRSGRPLREFADELGVNHHTLQKWVYRLRRREGSETACGHAMVPAPGCSFETTSQSSSSDTVAPQINFVELSAPVDSRFELELSGGRTLRIPQSFNLGSLGSLLSLLGARA